jgi:hypothetical protein
MYLPPWAFPTTINTFDFDGVVYFGRENPGVRPSPGDLIITGRSYEERSKTEEWCARYGITNDIIFSQIPLALKTREISGYHKALTLRELQKSMKIAIHFEDDPIQKEIIEAMVPDVRVVHLVHELTEK